MTYIRNVIVEQAKSWLGCNEADGSFKKIIDMYNSFLPRARNYILKYSDEWCSGYASAVAIAVKYTEIIPLEVGCEKHIQLFKNKGIWVENDGYIPKPGDYIFYDWNDNGKGDCTGSADHVGIVIYCDGVIIKVIEGNYSSCVKIRTLSVNGKYIRGFGVPKYDEDGDIDNIVETKLVVDGLWGPATTRRAQEVFGTPKDGIVSNQYLAYRINNPGLLDSSFEWEQVPGREGSALIKAIQKKIGVRQDGFIGPQTIRAMQSWLGTPVDGRVDNPSAMVKAFQRWLNKY